MSNTIEVTLPDVGDFDQVEIIEILVAVGDQVEAEDSLLTLESDKATMEIPSPHGGRVTQINVAVGDKISKGDPVLILEQASDSAQPVAEAEAEEKPEPQPDAAAPSATSDADIHAEVLVIGAGPGGYTAAFRAADLGKKTVLIEKYADLGGVCLNVGCIPSKALLHTADVINEAAELTEMGVDFGKPKIDLDKLRAGKQRVVKKLTGGLAGMAKQRKVTTVQGIAQFVDANSVSVATQEGSTSITFDHCIIAVGSRAVQIPPFPNDDPRLIDSTGALALEDVPKKLLVIGGGIIGLEMATVYSTLGSNIDIVEMQNQLMPGADKDLVRPLQKRLAKQVGTIMLETKVAGIKAQKNGLKVAFEGKHAPDKEQLYDRVLVAVGRSPNGGAINAEAAGVNVDERGFISVDEHMRTNVAHIYAIGDVVGNPMLAHKATHEAKVAAEVIAEVFFRCVLPDCAGRDHETASGLYHDIGWDHLRPHCQLFLPVGHVTVDKGLKLLPGEILGHRCVVILDGQAEQRQLQRVEEIELGMHHPGVLGTQEPVMARDDSAPDRNQTIRAADAYLLVVNGVRLGEQLLADHHFQACLFLGDPRLVCV